MSRSEYVIKSLSIALISSVLEVQDVVGQCRRLNDVQLPLYATSGAWSTDGKELLLADAKRKNVMRYFGSGRFVDFYGSQISSNLQYQKLQVVRATSAGLFFEVKGGRLLRVDGKSQAIKNMNIADPHSSLSIAGAFQWDVLGDDLITLSDVEDYRHPTDFQGRLALVRVPFKGSDFEVLRDLISDEDDAKIYYLLGFPYLAALEGAAYFFTFDQGIPSLFQYQRAGVRTSIKQIRLPVEFPVLAKMPSLTSRQLTTDELFQKAMAIVERSAVPVGLYGWDKNLFLLTREPTKNGSTWKIIRFNPSSPGHYAVAQLDSKANHLTIVPGGESWAFVEKGPVAGYGKQDVTGLFFVSANFFKGRMGLLTCPPR